MIEPTAPRALSERLPMKVTDRHFVLGTPLLGNFDSFQLALFGLGCFWGAEKKFWEIEGVHSTAVGYAAGGPPHPNYEEVCSSATGHNEVVRVVFDPLVVSYGTLLRTFWETHNPTQGMRQGNDRGSQYRSGIYYYSSEQENQALSSRREYDKLLQAASFAPITTEVLSAPTFYFAENYHQQYLAKNPGGYCGLGGTGIRCASGEVS